jgi:integrase/recombinase XerD
MRQAKVITPREFKRLLNVVASGRYAERNRVAIMLSYYAGMRVGEIAALLVSDIYMDDGQVKDQIVLEAAITKSNETRRIFVGVNLKRELAEYRHTFGKYIKPASPLLITNKGKAFSANILCQTFGALYKKAGIDGASSHSGRRWFITKLAHNGVSPKVIMELAGHKNLSTTQRYIDVNDDMMRKAVEVLGDAFK